MKSILFILLVSTVLNCDAMEIFLGPVSTSGCTRINYRSRDDVYTPQLVWQDQQTDVTLSVVTQPLKAETEHIIESCAHKVSNEIGLSIIAEDPVTVKNVFDAFLRRCLSENKLKVEIYDVSVKTKGPCAR